jgi:hypothetical protein
MVVLALPSVDVPGATGSQPNGTFLSKRRFEPKILNPHEVAECFFHPYRGLIIWDKYLFSVLHKTRYSLGSQ